MQNDSHPEEEQSILFRPVRAAFSSQALVEPGYQFVRATNSIGDRGAADLLVPISVAQRLELDAVNCLSRLAQASPRASPPHPVSVPASPSASRRDPKNHVEFEAEAFSCEPPSERPHVSILDTNTLQEAVERHNGLLGSSDTSDRARDAALLRQLIKAGPWRRCAAPANIPACIESLREELPHWPDLINLVEGELRLAGNHRPFSLPPILLVGRPGVGKTHAARRLAALLELPFKAIDLSVGQTNGFLHGSDRHWSNARPGALFELTALGSHANPLVLLDEIDKAAQTQDRYSPLAPLYSALEPETAKSTRDQCVDFEFDASRVIYVGTANTLRDIPPPVLSRFHLIYGVEPDLRASLSIARAISRQVLADKQLADFKPVTDRVLLELADRSPRLIRKALVSAVGKAAAAGRESVVLEDLSGPGECRQLH